MTESASISELAVDWSANGSPRPVASAVGRPYCSVTACGAMSYVDLMTSTGVRSVCFRHFEAIERDSRKDKRFTRPAADV